MATSAKASKGGPAGKERPAAAAGEGAGVRAAGAAGADGRAKPAGPGRDRAEGTGGGAGGGGGGRSPGLRIGDLVARVAENTGARKGTVRSVVEAALLEINRALDRDEAVVLPGVGRLWVTKSAERNGRTIRTAKIRSLTVGEAAGGAGEPLAKGTGAG